MQKSRRNITIGIEAISPHICCPLSTEEGKNNAIYVLNLQGIRKIARE